MNPHPCVAINSATWLSVSVVVQALTSRVMTSLTFNDSAPGPPCASHPKRPVNPASSVPTLRPASVSQSSPAKGPKESSTQAAPEEQMRRPVAPETTLLLPNASTIAVSADPIQQRTGRLHPSCGGDLKETSSGGQPSRAAAKGGTYASPRACAAPAAATPAARCPVRIARQLCRPD